METCDMEAWRNDNIAMEQWHVVMAAMGAPQSREVFRNTSPWEVFVRLHAWIWLSQIESECPSGRFVRN